MLKHDLLRHIGALPDDADIGIRVGDTHLGIDALVTWQETESLYELRCPSADLDDIINEWVHKTRRATG